LHFAYDLSETRIVNDLRALNKCKKLFEKVNVSQLITLSINFG